MATAENAPVLSYVEASKSDHGVHQRHKLYPAPFVNCSEGQICPDCKQGVLVRVKNHRKQETQYFLRCSKCNATAGLV